MKNIKQAFEPIVDEHSTVLILGTMPGEKSLELQQYYGHKGNHFWPLVFSAFELPVPDNYNQKVQFLHDQHIALWDVLSHCVREGSSDSNIKEEVVNNFEDFYIKYPHIKTIVWDSATAQKLYLRHVGKGDGKNYLLFPSPSRRYARMPFEEKLNHWKKLKHLVH